MLADSLDSREVDLSHLSLQISHSISPETTQATKKSFGYLVVGVIISVSIHAVILLINWRQDSITVEKPESLELIVHLQVVPKPEPTLERPVTPVEPDISEPTADVTPELQNVLPTPERPQIQVQQPETKTVVIQPLTADELREVIQSNHSANPAASTQGISANVFNPALRKQLDEEASKPELQRADAGPKTHTDPSGATIVDLGGGKCLRSSVPKLGEAQNWYMTSCGGKSESEKIMDSVNEAVNGKLKFGE